MARRTSSRRRRRVPVVVTLPFAIGLLVNGYWLASLIAFAFVVAYIVLGFPTSCRAQNKGDGTACSNNASGYLRACHKNDHRAVKRRRLLRPTITVLRWFPPAVHLIWLREDIRVTRGGVREVSLPEAAPARPYTVGGERMNPLELTMLILTLVGTLAAVVQTTAGLI